MSRSRDRLPTYLIGRSTQADIVLRDSTVSRLHAELVRARDGAWYLTDRGSTGGTFLRSDRGWTQIRQEFVRPGDRLKFGNFECGADELLRWISTGEATPSGAGKEPAGQGSPVRDDRPAGPVLRDPATGDVISAKDE
ncbi:MAG: FHA domain-containing protein [Rhodospirillaceae bacterium]|nr:FHA domain-containing protein [Rhodospirillaceae bacterium]